MSSQMTDTPAITSLKPLDKLEKAGLATERKNPEEQRTFTFVSCVISIWKTYLLVSRTRFDNCLVLSSIYGATLSLLKTFVSSGLAGLRIWLSSQLDSPVASSGKVNSDSMLLSCTPSIYTMFVQDSCRMAQGMEVTCCWWWARKAGDSCRWWGSSM